MKVVTLLSLLLLLASPVFGELTKEDVRTIMKEEIAASEKRLKEYIDLKIETVNARIDALDKSLNARIDATNTRIDATNIRIDALDKKIGLGVVHDNCTEWIDNSHHCNPSNYHRLQRKRSEGDANPN